MAGLISGALGTVTSALGGIWGYVAAGVFCAALSGYGVWYATDTYFQAKLGTVQTQLAISQGNVHALQSGINFQNNRIAQLNQEMLEWKANAKTAQDAADKRAAEAEAKANDILNSQPGNDKLISAQEIVENSVP